MRIGFANTTWNMTVRFLGGLFLFAVPMGFGQTYTVENQQNSSNISAVSACGANYTFSLDQLAYNQAVVHLKKDGVNIDISAWSKTSVVFYDWGNKLVGVDAPYSGVAYTATLHFLFSEANSTISVSETVPTCGPAVSTYFPADNATNVARQYLELNLKFNGTVQKGTGNIVLKKTSDNSTVESIAVTSGAVTQVVDSLIHGFESGVEWADGSATISWTSAIKNMGGSAVKCVIGGGGGNAGKNYGGVNWSTYDSLIMHVYPLQTQWLQIYTQSGAGTTWHNNAGWTPTAYTWTRIAYPISSISNSSDVKTAGINAGPGTYYIDNVYLKRAATNYLRIPIATTLAQNTEYYVNFDAGVVKDMSNNNIDALSSTTAWSFSTGGTVFTWDNSTDAGYTPPATGTWGTDLFWSPTGTSLQAWPGEGNKAVFAGTNGTYAVTVNGTQSADTIQIDNTGYTLSGGTVALTGPAPVIAANVAATVSSTISGSYTKTGAGELTVGVSYAGPSLTVAAGTLTTSGADNTNGFLADVTVSDGATLKSGNSDGIGNSQTVNLNGANAIWNMNGKWEQLGWLTGSGQVTNNNFANGLTLDLADGATQTFSGTVAGSSLFSVRGANATTTAGTLILSGASTYSGITYIVGGSGATNNAKVNVQLIDGDNRLPSGTTLYFGEAAKTGLVGKLIIGNGSAARSQTIADLIDGDGSGTFSIVGAHATNNSTFTLNNAAAVDYAGFLGGAGSNENKLAVVKAGAGTLTLRGNSTFSGGYTHQASDLFLMHNNALGTGPVIMNGSGRIYVDNGLNIANNITISYCNPGVGMGAIMVDDAKTGTWSGTITVDSTCAFGGHIATAGTGILNVTGALNNDGTPVVQRAGTVVYSGGGNATAFSITEGTARLGANNGLPTTAVFRQAHATLTSALDLNGYNQTLGYIGSEANGNVSINNVGAASTLTLNGSIDTIYQGQITGSIALVKTGSYKQTLSGTNTYTGTTTISAGTLLVNGSLASGSAVSVNAGTLAGSGTVAGTIAVASGATVAPGAATGVSIATLATGAVTFVAGATYSVDLNGTAPTYDLINSTGAVTLGNATLTIANIANAAAGKIYTIVNGTSVAGEFNGLANGSTFSQQSRTFQISYTSTAVTLTDVTGVAPSTKTWTGAGADNSWTNPANWGGLAPLPGDILVFAGNTRLAPNNNFTAGTSFASISFNLGSGNFVVGGNALVLTAGATAVASSATSGTMTLNNNITFSTSAPTISSIAGGSLTMGGTIANGGLLVTVNAAEVINLNGAMSGLGGLTKTGAAALVLSGANAYTGATTITAGTLKLGAAGVIPDASAVTVTGTLDMNTFSETVGSITGAGTIDNVAGAGTPTLTCGGDNTTTTFSGVITDASGALSLTKTGSGTLILTGANTYSGTSTISAGTLQIGNGSSTGILPGDVVNNSILTFNRDNNFTYSGTISGTGAVNHIGTGLLTLSGANSYDGLTTIGASSSLYVGNNSALGSTVGGTELIAGPAITTTNLFLKSDVTISGETLTMNSNSVGDLRSALQAASASATWDGPIILAGTGSVHFWATSTYSLAITGNVSGSCGALYLRGNASGTGIITTALSIGTTSLVKQETGTWTLAGANTYTGGTTVLAGTLQVGNGGTSGDLPGAVANSGTITFNRTDGVTLSGVFSGNGAINVQSGTSATFLADNTATGAVENAGTLNIGNGASGTIPGSSVNNTGLLTVNRSNAYVYSGSISGNGTMEKSLVGTFTVTGTNTMSGSTLVKNGAFQVGNNSTTGTWVGPFEFFTSNTPEVVFNRSDDYTYAGVISGVNTNADIEKKGAGILTLSGTNTNNGTTTVTAGTLNLTGSLASTSASVPSGSILAGNGSAAGSITVSDGGIVAPGDASTGTLSANAMVLNNASVLNFELGTSKDLVAVSGALTLDGVLNVTNLAGFSHGTYTLFTYGSLTANNTITLGTMPGGYNYTITANAGVVVLRVSTTPAISSNGAGPTASINAAENQTAVTTVTSTDTDGETPSYSITGGADAAKFSIVANTGVLTFVAGPNFESATDANGNGIYEVQVTVSDGYGGTDVQDISVTVTNVNETPTDLAIDDANIAEGAGANAVVGNLSTTDVDAGDSHTYTLVAGVGADDNASFNINTAQLRAGASLNFEAKSSYTVRVRTTDAGGLWYEEAIAITVTDANDAPTDLAIDDANIAENAGVNAVVGNLSTTDADAGDTHTYTLVAGIGADDNASFNINAAQLRAGASLNFETKASYTVRVRTTDAGGLWYEEAIAITVTNVNEAPTDLAIDDANITENAGVNAVVGNLSTTDVDAGDTHTYTLVAGVGADDNASFNINSGELRATASLNFEVKSSYTVRVRTTDAGGLWYEEAIAITVTDANDAPTDLAIDDANIAENAGANAVVGNLSTTDVDAGDSHTYTLVAGVGADDNASFNINSGELRASASLNFETKSSYTVRVRTTDAGGLWYEEAIAITVTNVNEAPTVANALLDQNATEDAAFSYAFAANSFADPDLDALSYSATLVGGGALPGWLTFTAGTRTFSGTPANADVGTISIRVTASDGSLSITDDFDLTVANTNDAPTVANALLDQNATEDVAFSYVFAANSFNDIDVGDLLSYSATLVGGGALPGWFTFTAGTRTFSGTPTNADVGTISIRVTASDGSLSITDDFDLTVSNANDAPTDLAIDDANIAENAGVNAVVGNLSTTDADAGDSHTYTLVAGIGADDNASFNINSGELRATASLNYEVKSSYTVRVRTTDAGGLWYEEAIAITVTNVNETPTDLAIDDANIAENAGVNAVVGNLSTTDIDAGDTHTYTLVAGIGADDNASFNINSGELRATASLNFEVKSSYTVRVRTTDAGGLWYEEAIAVTVTNANEAPTDLAIDDANIAEGAGANAVVGNLSTTDVDAGDTHTYTLVAGIGADDNASFNINSGELRATASLNFEVKSSYTVRVRTTDAGGLFYEEAIAITVTNVNEAPTDLAIDDANIAENAGANAVVGNLSTTDADAGDSHTYTLVAGLGADDNASFNINSGELRAGASLNFETKSSYTVRVRTTDAGGLWYEEAIAITVTNVNEAPTVANALLDQNATEDAAFSYAFAANSFADPDLDALSYSATLVGGGALPGWLTFTAGTRTFSGTPANADVGTISIRVTASDGSLSITDDFDLTVANTNDAPTVANALLDQNATEDVAFSYVFAANSFNDIDVGDLLSYSATLVGGGALPGWLTFTAGTRTFSGTPTNADVGTISIRVTASDGSLSITDDFDLTVSNANDAPTDLAIDDANIAENAGVNAVVGNLSTTDADAGDTHTYTLVAGIGADDNASFNINAAQLRAGASLNFETKSSYTVRVRTTDAGGLWYEESIAITVTDVNEAPSITSSATWNVVENQISVGTITSVDPDAAATATYSLAGGVDDALFTIDGATGVLEFLSAPNYEAPLDAGANNVYNITVQVSDGLLATTQGVAITVTDVTGVSINSDGGGATAAINLAENQTMVTTVVAIDEGAAAATFSLSGGVDQAMFDIDANTGVLTFSAAPNFENPLDNGTNNTYVVEVTATVPGPATDVQTITVTITNVNEAPTDLAIDDANIAENAGVNAVVGNLSTTDVDAGDTHTYTLVAGIGADDNASFNINSGELRATASLNYEVKSSYTVRVRTTDAGGLWYEEAIAITVTDANDAPTDLAIDDANIAENAGANAVVGNLSTTDVDAGDSHTYTFVAGAGDTDNASFNFNGAALRAGASLNFETKSAYTVRVRTTDAGGLWYEEAIAITVTNVNETPTLDNALVDQNATEDVAFSYAFAANSFADPDLDALTYSATLVGGGALPAWLTFTAGTRTFSGTPANADVGTISIRVTASDGSLSITDDFDLTVANVNDAPIVANALLDQNATEDVVFSYPFAANSFADPDLDALTYSATLVGGGALPGWLTFTAGTRTFSGTPTNADVGTISIRVTASDASLSVTDDFDLTVANANDAPTDLALDDANIAENAGANAVVGNLSTTDVDASDSHTYTFVAGAGDTDNASFNFNGAGLRAGASLNFETKSGYTVRVRTTDAGGLWYEEAIAITVTNVNETPTDLAIDDANIAENAGANAVVGNLATTDADAGDTHTYTLVSGIGATDNASFNFNGTQLRAGVSLNFETKSAYTVRVRTTDAGGLFYEEAIAITVTNANDAPTDLAIDDANIAENAGANAVVGNLTTTDVDAGDTHTYSFVAGAGSTDNASFNFNGAQLRAGASLNFEAKSSYTVRVRTTDAGGLFYEEAIVVTVTNVNETPTNLAIDHANIAENAGANAVVGNLSTTDVDFGDSHTYTFVAGAGDSDNAIFNFNGAALRASASLNFETKSSYTVRVRTTDVGGLFYEESIAITVTNANDAPTDLAIDDATIVENAGANAVIGNLSTTDVDAGDTHTYSLVAGVGATDNASFNINGAQLRAVASLNFEAKSSYTVRVRTTDAGGLFYEEAIVVTVTNVNEAPSITSTANWSVAENQTTVGTVTATDPDAGAAVSYSLVGGLDAALFSIDGATGSLEFLSAPDFENPLDAGANHVFNVTVEVDDGNLTSTQNVVVTVTNVNDSWPMLVGDTVIVSENNLVGDSLFRMLATDADGSLNPLSYQILSGNSLGKFAIASGTGKITMAGILDFETANAFTLRIEVSDGIHRDSSDLWIQVTDVLEIDSIPTMMTLSQDTIVLKVGEKDTLQRVLRNAAGDTLDNLYVVQWSSRSETTATVSSGIVEALAIGTTRVLASFQSLRDSTWVRVVGLDTLVGARPDSSTLDVGGGITVQIPPADTSTLIQGVPYTPVDRDGISVIGNGVSFVDSLKQGALLNGDVVVGIKVDSVKIPDGYDTSDLQFYRENADGSVERVTSAYESEGFFKIRTNSLERFFLAVDTMPPQIALLSAPNHLHHGDPVEISYEFMEQVNNPTIRLFWKKAGDTLTHSRFLADTELDGIAQVAEALWEETGATVWLQADDGVHQVNTILHDLMVKLDAVVMKDSLPEDRYDILSVPYMQDSITALSLLQGQLGKVDAKRWRSYVIEDSVFVEITERDSLYASAGQAYWLRTKGVSPRFVMDSLQTYPNSKMVGVVLQPGWNSIGSPYLFDVSWQSILDASGLNSQSLSGLYAFDPETKSWSNPDTTDRLVAWKGYLVKNLEDTAITLQVPSLAFQEQLAKRLAKANADVLRFPLQASQQSGDVTYAYAGISAKAKADYDQQDQMLPPSPGSHLKAYFKHHDWGKFAGTYISDHRKTGDSSYTWTFRVAGITPHRELLLTKPSIAKDSNMNTWLVDRKSGRVLAWDSTLSVAVGKESMREFDFVLAKTAPQLPTQQMGGMSNDLVFTIEGRRIQWMIPAAMGRTMIQIDLIGIDGRTVKRILEREQQDEGIYSMELPSDLPKGPAYRILLRAGDRLYSIPNP